MESNMNKRVVAIILAAGKGSRMKADIPKQYLMLCGKPVLYYSIRAFENANVDHIIVVTGASEEETCRNLLAQYKMKKQVTIITGGKERYDSVYEGLKASSNADYVLIHDGARPLVTTEQIDRLIEEVKKEHGAILAVPLKDTMKRANQDMVVEQTLQRDGLYIVQTPQGFPYQILMDAYYDFHQDTEENQRLITDDAMIVENYTEEHVWLVEGSYHNIKITTPEDLTMAEYFFHKLYEKA